MVMVVVVVHIVMQHPMEWCPLGFFHAIIPYDIIPHHRSPITTTQRTAMEGSDPYAYQNNAYAAQQQQQGAMYAHPYGHQAAAYMQQHAAYGGAPPGSMQPYANGNNTIRTGSSGLNKFRIRSSALSTPLVLSTSAPIRPHTIPAPLPPLGPGSSYDDSPSRQRRSKSRRVASGGRSSRGGYTDDGYSEGEEVEEKKRKVGKEWRGGMEDPKGYPDEVERIIKHRYGNPLCLDDVADDVSLACLFHLFLLFHLFVFVCVHKHMHTYSSVSYCLPPPPSHPHLPSTQGYGRCRA